MKYILALADADMTKLEQVGGKNASLGEMLQHLTHLGVNVPGGFATTTDAYRRFLQAGKLEEPIHQCLEKLNVQDLAALQQTSHQIRQWILNTDFSKDFEAEIESAYTALANPVVAVRSSATAEDLADASFAGQQETYLNVYGLEPLLSAIKAVYASLFTPRAISYRHHHKIPHQYVAISVGVQPMVRSDLAASGVIFTIDTESGFDQVIFITASYGLGEMIVQGKVNPDEFYVFKPTLKQQLPAIVRRNLGNKATKMIFAEPNQNGEAVKIVDVPITDQQHFCLNDADIHTLAQYALLIEQHYGRPMDIEWAKDGIDGQLYILQARPETGASRKNQAVIERYQLIKPGTVLTQGRSIGQKIGQGIARIVTDPKAMHALQQGEVLVTEMTDPDWEPIMKMASAIVTNRGGRTCHAAIIARELGIPAVVGCGNATAAIEEGAAITVSCAEGEAGHVYAGLVPFKIDKISVKELPKLPVNVCINLGNPEKAFTYQSLPNQGVGLARLEFIISNNIKIHPNALLQFDQLPQELQDEIKQLTAAYPSPVEFYIEKMCEGIATIAAGFYPKQVIFRFSDFKSNEYANLIGGKYFEPKEENPMIGFRGASRYVADSFKACFALECEAFKRVRDKMALVNTQVMVPFVRTVDEMRAVVELMQDFGLQRGKNGLKIYMMCEIPSNVLLAKEFLQYCDGFSIGSNDLTQLTLGLDRDSDLVASIFDERNAAVKILLQHAIAACNAAGKYVGICGQAPSDHPDLAQWLVEQGIQSISLSADRVVETWMLLAQHVKAKQE